MLAVIGGTGFYTLGKKIETLKADTGYGPAEAQKVRILDEELLFLPRHGPGHTIAPHKINYRANIAALKEFDATGVLTFHAAGAISKFRPGDLVLVDDFIGLFTPATFHDDFSGGMRHADFSSPFSKEMRGKLIEVAAAAKVKLKTGGIIASTPGPRFETKAEVKALGKMGANLLSMTSGYEMALLGEAEMDFVSIAVATNFAAGVSKKPLSAEEVVANMKGAYGQLVALIGGFAEEVV
ncbi:MAG: MTAP family purine nucleoside phosphorylase [Candidatus Micrarchaeota archaeon]